MNINKLILCSEDQFEVISTDRQMRKTIPQSPQLLYQAICRVACVRISLPHSSTYKEIPMFVQVPCENFCRAVCETFRTLSAKNQS